MPLTFKCFFSVKHWCFWLRVPAISKDYDNLRIGLGLVDKKIIRRLGLIRYLCRDHIDSRNRRILRSQQPWSMSIIAKINYGNLRYSLLRGLWGKLVKFSSPWEVLNPGWRKRPAAVDWKRYPLCVDHRDALGQEWPRNHQRKYWWKSSVLRNQRI